MAFILNRRAKLRASAIPVEIPDASTVVKKTDKASATKLGLVKIGDNVNISSGGAISVSDASSETKGLIKLGTGLSVNAETGAVDAVGGMTWTKIFDEAAASSASKTFDEGVDLFAHKLVFIQVYSTNPDEFASAYILPEVKPSEVTSVSVNVVRASGTRAIAFTATGFTMPSNMSAANVLIYVLD